MYFYLLVDTAKKTWKVLRQQFKIHFDKLPLPKTGDPAPEDEVDWPYFKSLLFLRDVFEKRPTSGNLPETEGEPDVDEEDDRENVDLTSPTPTPSSSSPSVEHYSASTSRTKTTKSSSAEAPTTPKNPDNLGYRKRYAPMEMIGKGLLDIEKEKMKIRKEKEMAAVDKNDEDVAFFASLLPHVRKLSPVKKLQFRTKIQQLLLESAYGTGSEENRSTSPWGLNPGLSTSSSRSSLGRQQTFDTDNCFTVLQPLSFDNFNTNYN